MDNIDIFNLIFNQIMVKHNLTAWYELFDSELFEQVGIEICKYFNVSSPCAVPGYVDWHNEMYWDL